MGEHESGGRRMSVLAVCSSLQSIPARGGGAEETFQVGRPSHILWRLQCKMLEDGWG